MDKKEVVEVLKTVSNIYGNKFKVDDPKSMLEAWYTILIDFDYDYIMQNLKEYAKINRFAPSIADLINIGTDKDRVVPSYDETKQMLERWEKDKANIADEAIAKNHLAEMRKILGIKRG